jgi:hypothetical protein
LRTFRTASGAEKMHQEHAMTSRLLSRFPSDLLSHLQPQPRSRVHRLRRHQFVSLRRPQGLCLRAERGTLWVTVDGDPADIELAPGDSRVFDGRATVVVGTLGGDAVLSVTARRSTAWMARLRGWMRGGPCSSLQRAAA